MASPTGISKCAFQLELRGRERARSELVLQAANGDRVRRAVVETRWIRNNAEPTRALRAPLRAGQRECHLGSRRAGEPLRAEQAPRPVVARRATVPVRPTSEPPVVSVIH